MLSEQDIVEVIVTHLRERLPPDTAIGPQSTIMGDLGLDSLAVMNFVMWLEENFDISVPMDRLIEVETVADLARVLHSLGAQKAS
jgi:acyl carrier protein